MNSLSARIHTASPWRSALIWGFGIALAQRAALLVWMASVWLAAGSYFAGTADFQTPQSVRFPPLSAVEQPIFGVWRRWDTIHYFNLALNGYNQTTEDLSVFPPLTSWGIYASDLLLPGGIDLAGMVSSSLWFGLALSLLYRICDVMFPSDIGLGRWTVVVTALLPLGHFFSAPMSDGPYLALALATVYASTVGRWPAAALCGFLAAVTRSQGVLLMGVAGLFLWSQCWQRHKDVARAVWCAARQGWVLLLIPFGLLAFTFWRSQLGLASLDSIYAQDSQRFFVTPIEGLWLNVRWWVLSEPMSVDLWVLAVSLVGTTLLIARERTRRLPLTAYTVLHLAVFLTPINYQYDTNTVSYTQSIGRYCLALFPLAILLARALQHSGRSTRLLGFAAMITMALILSARHALGLLGP